MDGGYHDNRRNAAKEKRVVSVYSWNDGHESADMYSFGDEIPSDIYPDLKIRLADVV